MNQNELLTPPANQLARPTDQGQLPKQHLDGGLTALVVLVVAAYLTILTDLVRLGTRWPLPVEEWLLLLGAGGLYTAVAWNDSRVVNLFPRNFGWFIFYLIQLTLVAIIGLVAEQNGQWWLLILPVVSMSAEQGQITLSVVSMAAVLMVTGLYCYIDQSLAPLLIIPFYLFPAVVFVALFSRTAVRERRLREETERLARELQQANHLLSQYAATVEELTIVKERNRIAREIHDTLGHYLTVVHVQLGAAQAVLTHNTDKARDALQKAQTLTQDGLTEVRRSVGVLRQDGQDQRPLPAQIAPLIAELESSGVAVKLTILGEMPPDLHRQPVAHTLFRVVQEGVTNIQKHAQASHTAVVLDFTEGEWISLRIEDDGVGTAVAEGGFGLLGMRERANLLGGSLAIDTSPGHGFHLTLRLPRQPHPPNR